MKKLLALIIVVISIIFLACKHLPPEESISEMPQTPPAGTPGNNGGNGGLLPCDSNQFEFAAHIQPILKTHCIGCHSGSNPADSIDLTNYLNVKPVATSGRLYGSVAQLPGYDSMPKGAAKLSDCEIAQIAKWTQSGSPDN